MTWKVADNWSVKLQTGPFEILWTYQRSKQKITTICLSSRYSCKSGKMRWVCKEWPRKTSWKPWWNKKRNIRGWSSMIDPHWWCLYWIRIVPKLRPTIEWRWQERPKASAFPSAKTLDSRKMNKMSVNSEFRAFYTSKRALHSWPWVKITAWCWLNSHLFTRLARMSMGSWVLTKNSRMLIGHVTKLERDLGLGEQQIWQRITRHKTSHIVPQSNRKRKPRVFLR